MMIVTTRLKQEYFHPMRQRRAGIKCIRPLAKGSLCAVCLCLPRPPVWPYASYGTSLAPSNVSQWVTVSSCPQHQQEREQLTGWNAQSARTSETRDQQAYLDSALILASCVARFADRRTLDEDLSLSPLTHQASVQAATALFRSSLNSSALLLQNTARSILSTFFNYCNCYHQSTQALLRTN